MPHALGADRGGSRPRLGRRAVSMPLVVIAVTLLLVAASVLAVLATLPPAPQSAAAATLPDGTSLQAAGLPNAWTNLSPPSAPSVRLHPAIAYDSRTGEVFLFGGWGPPYSQPLNDTWSYNPSTNRWTNRSPATHPEESCSVCFGTVAMVYDSRADRIILYGANEPPWGMPNQTWAYDPNGNTWTQMHPASNPGFAHDFGFAYDSVADRVLRFGGGSITPHYYDIGNNGMAAYDYTNDTWTALAPASVPSVRYGAGMAYDSQADRTLLFGGCTNGDVLWPGCALANDTWAYDYGTNAWTDRTPRSNPPAGVGLPLVYDAGADHLIQFGEGRGTGNHTWAYNYAANVWTSQHPANSPPPRSSPAMVYDAAGGLTILFGGVGSSYQNDTWSYTYGAVSITPPSAPLNLVASPGTTSNTQDQVTLSWQPPANDGGYAVTGYRIYRGTAAGAESFLVAVGSTLSYVDPGLIPTTRYYYQVAAVSAAGEGTRSVEVVATPADLTLPTVVMTYPMEGATLTATTVTVRGTASDDVAVQKVEVSVNNGTWSLASGTNPWSLSVTLLMGRNLIVARATDPSGNVGLAGANVTVTSGGPSGGQTGENPSGVSGLWVGMGILAAGVAVAGVLAGWRFRPGRRKGPPN